MERDPASAGSSQPERQGADLPSLDGQISEDDKAILVVQNPVSLPPGEGHLAEGDERRVRVAERWSDIGMRVALVVIVGAVFLYLNHEVMALVRAMFEADVVALSLEPRPDRVITTEVVKNLIFVTAAQAGAGIAAIVAYLFAKRRDP
jgi:hypothetical protein